MLHDQPPEWAWPFPPSIPLIGRRFKVGRGLLIYASAENLTWLNDDGPPEQFGPATVWNRYRARYELARRGGKSFFPDIGIQPVNDGGLLAAGLFVSDLLRLPRGRSPREFLERVAVSNWCKFSIRTAERNRDYLGDQRRLIESLPFVVCELAVLQPAVVLLPQAVWRHAALRAAMRGASPLTRFLPTYQFNATVVNTSLQRFDRAGRQLRQRCAGTTLGGWMARLKRIRVEYAWRYIASLEVSAEPRLSTVH